MKGIGWMMGLAAGFAAMFCVGWVCRADTDDSGRYTYEIQDGKAAILHYTWHEEDETLTVPDTLGGAPVTELAAGAFTACYSDTVILPEGLTIIGENCFQDCGYLTQITLPRGLETIGASAFDSCTMLRQVEIPDSVTEIEAAAFSGTPWLEERSEDVVIVGAGILLAYRGDVATYEIPETVHSIAAYAFANCTVLESVTIPASVKAIREGAFDNCTALTEVILPQNAEITVSVDALLNTPWFRNQPDGCALIGKTLYRYKGSEKNPVIPEGVTVIGESAFERTEIVSVTLPPGVTEIRRAAFYGCESLRSVFMSPGLERIETMGFYHCTALSGVVLPEGLDSIGDYAFAACPGLQTMTVPASVTELGNRCLGYDYISGEEGFVLRQDFRLCTESKAAKDYAAAAGIPVVPPEDAKGAGNTPTGMSMGRKRLLFGGVMLAGGGCLGLLCLLLRRKGQKTAEK